jgi:hypothetical protein
MESLKKEESCGNKGMIILYNMYKNIFVKIVPSYFRVLVHTLQGKSHLCIPFLGIARPQSQFPHSCVCERFMYSQDRSTYFPVAE